MRSKLMLITTAFILMLQLDVQAATIYASDGSQIADNSNICAYDSYYYEADSSEMLEASIVSTDTRMLLQTVHANDGEIEFVFPSNVSDLSIYVYSFEDNGKQLVDEYELKVSDCGYEETVDKYSTTNPQTKISVDGTTISFTKPELDDYHLYYNQVEENDDGKARELKFKDSVGSVELVSDYFQITEEYTNKDGKEVARYYEINLTDDPIIRKMKKLDLSIIEPMQYIDRVVLIRLFFGLIVLVILYLININLMKTYKAKKEYRRKLKVLKQKRREQIYRQRQEQELEKKKKYAQQKRKQAEQKQRANLEIRK